MWRRWAGAHWSGPLTLLPRTLPTWQPGSFLSQPHEPERYRDFDSRGSRESPHSGFPIFLKPAPRTLFDLQDCHRL